MVRSSPGFRRLAKSNAGLFSNPNGLKLRTEFHVEEIGPKQDTTRDTRAIPTCEKLIITTADETAPSFSLGHRSTKGDVNTKLNSAVQINLVANKKKLPGLIVVSSEW